MVSRNPSPRPAAPEPGALTPQFRRLAVLGVGLLGGSFALAAKRAALAREVVGYSKSPSTIQAAIKAGVIDHGADSALQAATGADLVVLAVPVAAIGPLLRQIRLGLSDSALLLDVGSTKADVADAALHALGEAARQFVPCHPIAGSERSGVQHAQVDLFDGRRVVVTPLEANPARFVDAATQVWEALGGVVSVMSPHEHDAAFAAVSHLPHLLAFAFVYAIARQPQGSSFLQLAGPGFRDFTRIAGSDPTMWRDVFQANSAEVLQQLQMFKQAVAGFEAQLRQGNWSVLESLIRQASQSRRDWASPSPADDAT
ncbi:prephenate dehydrogenase/arogenate dehydrogenase family protein [Thiomonas sp.]|jgi:prephenate dehydrogenase|uniref:prephenate dehydrogenase n=1 Tax=Thiomonas sp. TaxID=2047785 RepID=UPI0026147F09|nr:prephenate dehydrogenase/arogenate dehydrogenase family protein [Thiomonas sp.]